MGALSQFFSHLYTITLIFFTLLILEIVILVRSIAGLNPNSSKRVITTTQYLKLIEQKNPTTCYTQKLRSVRPEATECSVCLSEFEEGDKIRQLKCKHTFHQNCLDRWLQQYWATCPLCRTKVLSDDVVASYHRLRNQVQYDGSDEELIFLLSSLQGNSLHRFF
ncbi:unnamed protein product [Prunus armeniaca]|uniref:RING-type domain-containing protein n=2 Tax=Prunus TaxID=3754 RepID=A0A6J5XIQ7_PRUAR|nr:hypothetical protein L3X38_033484 [Prunus dulcis]CAB4283435.1 unnamed protein product [Prunus armeniaca]CAB4313866.1 unnamed protein product [Prunus armeniaca]